jgi:hypothetical protein
MTNKQLITTMTLTAIITLAIFCGGMWTGLKLSSVEVNGVAQPIQTLGE